MSDTSQESTEITIVTDGITDLLSQVRRDPRIIVVPCPVRIGKETYASNVVRGDQLAAETSLEVFAPSYGEFLRVYQDLESSSTISIHAPCTLREVSHQARLARNLLFPRGGMNIAIFESKTTDTAVGFLVKAASETAGDQKGYEVGQILLMLHLLQTELIRTFLVTRSIGPFIGKLGLGRWERLQSRIPGKEFLLDFDPRSSYFRLLARGSGFSYNLAQWGQFLENVQKPCQIRMMRQGFQQAAQGLRDQLIRAFRPQSIQLQTTSISSLSYPKEYLEITFYPVDDEVEKIRGFAARVWKAYGTYSSDTPWTV